MKIEIIGDAKEIAALVLAVQERLLEHRQKGRVGAAPRPVRGHRPHPGGNQSAGRFQKQQG